MENTNLPSINKQLLPIAVLKNLSAYTKIKDFDKVGHLVIPICNKHAVLSGIDKEIDQFTKEEIAKYTSLHLKNLSFEEIEIAFQNERFNLYEKKTIHYNFFSVEYFVEIINKYKVWKRSQMTIHNISMNTNLLPENTSTTTETEKKKNRIMYIDYIFNELQQTKSEIVNEAFTLYEDFIEHKLIVVTDQQKIDLYKVMLKEVQKEQNNKMFHEKNPTLKKDIKKFLQSLNHDSKNTLVVNRSKAFLVCKAIKEHKTTVPILEKLNLLQ